MGDMKRADRVAKVVKANRAGKAARARRRPGGRRDLPLADVIERRRAVLLRLADS